MQTIDMTPTWEAQANMCLIIINNSGSVDAITAAKEELLRMARLLDQLQAASREAVNIQQDIEFVTEVDK